jgi:hypothetical protein
MLGDASFEQVTEAIPSTTQTAAVADFNSSLVAHYTFDEGTVSTTEIKHKIWVDFIDKKQFIN